MYRTAKLKALPVVGSLVGTFLCIFLGGLLCATAKAADVKITTSSLPQGTMGVAYSATVNTMGGSVPFTWSVSSGALPPGLGLTPSSNTRSAIVCGTPTTSGTYNFSISVKGHGGHTSTASYSVVIAAPEPEHTVELQWSDSGGDIVGYNVFRGTVSGGPYSQINASLVASPYYSDTTVQDGVTYYYVTTAVDNQGEQSNYSNEAEAKVPGN